MVRGKKRESKKKDRVGMEAWEEGDCEEGHEEGREILVEKIVVKGGLHRKISFPFLFLLFTTRCVCKIMCDL